MNNLELFRLFKNSRLAQVATPLLEHIRKPSSTPTHQTIFTPKSSAIRSQFGLKTSLPKNIGYGYIAFNDIDNFKSMPDVEKCTSKMHTRLRFQESNLVLRSPLAKENRLFRGESLADMPMDQLLGSFNVESRAMVRQVREALLRRPGLHASFKRFLVDKYPKVLLDNKTSDVTLRGMMSQFLQESNLTATKRRLSSLTRNSSHGSSRVRSVQGTAGLSYSQKGRLQNSPNGIKYGCIMPGRLISGMEVAIGGFVASVNDRKSSLLQNYTSNYPGKHQRQFSSPFKVLHAELAESGGIRMQADVIKAGLWAKSRSFDNMDRSSYQPSNPDFTRATERANLDKLDRLLRIIG